MAFPQTTLQGTYDVFLGLSCSLAAAIVFISYENTKVISNLHDIKPPQSVDTQLAIELR